MISQNVDLYNYCLENFQDVLSLWCKKIPYKSIESEIDPDVLYTQCIIKAREYIKANIEDWRVGGNNLIVVIDSFPLTDQKSSNQQTVLGCAEILNIPPKYYFETAAVNPQTLLSFIKYAVRPGSVLVLEDSLYTVEVVRHLKQIYPVIVSTGMLKKHDTATQNVISNLSVVWTEISSICDNATDVFNVEDMLTLILWKQKFTSYSFPMLIYQIIGD